MELEKRFTKPDNWNWGRIKTVSGRDIRYGCVLPENPFAIVVISPGLTEYGEKYFEVARDMLSRNLGVYVIDWYGQGKSGRYFENDMDKRHCDDFDRDIDDFHSLITEKIIPNSGELPLILLAHSMGGNIGMRYLMKYPDIFSGAAFSAPMFGIKIISSMPYSISDFISFIHNKAISKRYVYGGGDADKSMNERNVNNFFSSDPIRFKIHNYWMEQDKELRIGSPTFGWVYHALKSCRRLFRELEEKAPKLPILIALAKKEKLVSNSKIRKAVNIIPNVALIELDCFHEILMEKDDIRNQFLASFDDLVDNVITD